MTTLAFASSRLSIPGPPHLLPGRPDAIVDLQTDEGAELVGAVWRWSEAKVEEIDFVSVGPDLGPSGAPNRTYDVVPHAEPVDFDDSAWRVLTPIETQERLGTGKVCFTWYRLTITVPERIGDLDPTGATLVFECVIDDYAEIWVDGKLPLALGLSGGQVAAGFNAPNRVVLTRDARAGQQFHLAVFAINGPISVSPANYVWLRSATVDVYSGSTVGAEPVTPLSSRVATGFAGAEGVVVSADGAVLFSDAVDNTVYRWSPLTGVSAFRVKSGYAGVDVGRLARPGSSGLAFDREGRLLLCQQGNRRVLRVEPHGNTTVLLDSVNGRTLNSPWGLTIANDGTTYVTDQVGELGRVIRLGVDGVASVVTDELREPRGVALSSDALLVVDLASSALWAVEASTGRLDMLAQLSGPTGALALSADGRVYVGDAEGVLVLTPAGATAGRIDLPEPVTGIALTAVRIYLTSATSLYVCEGKTS